MKKILLGLLEFFNRPFLVFVVTLPVALILGWQVYYTVNDIPTPQFVAAKPGSIIPGGATTPIILGFLSGGKVSAINVSVGDTVHVDDVLATLDDQHAQGAITQAKAAYAVATANYSKILRGSTGPTIDVSQVAVNTAQTNLDEVTRQQNGLVQNAYTALLNTELAVYPKDDTINENAPTISGSYVLGQEGIIKIDTYSSDALSGLSYSVSGLATGTAPVNSVIPQPLGDSGLHIQFSNKPHPNQTWILSIPNKKSNLYITKLNSYKTAMQTQSQVVATARTVLEQAQSNLALVVAKARPEDVAAAKAQVESAHGTLQVAEAAYNTVRIKAPIAGIVSAVYISVGQLATPNARAIELTEHLASTTVAVMVPINAVVTNGNESSVLLKDNTGIRSQTVATGVRDNQNIEILSGVVVGDQVEVQE